jgi:hypothetical protein
MGSNAPKFPYRALPIILERADKIVVGHNFLKLIVINRTKKMETILILGKVTVMVLNGMNNAGSETLTILLRWHKERAANKIIGINNRHRRCAMILPMIRRGDGNRVMTGLDNGCKGQVLIERVQTKVATRRIKSRAYVRMINDLVGVIGKNFERHGMTNMFSNTNPSTAFLMRVQREVGIVNLIIDGFIPTKK